MLFFIKSAMILKWLIGSDVRAQVARSKLARCIFDDACWPNRHVNARFCSARFTAQKTQVIDVSAEKRAVALAFPRSETTLR